MSDLTVKPVIVDNNVQLSLSIFEFNEIKRIMESYYNKRERDRKYMASRAGCKTASTGTGHNRKPKIIILDP